MNSVKVLFMFTFRHSTPLHLSEFLLRFPLSIHIDTNDRDIFFYVLYPCQVFCSESRIFLVFLGFLVLSFTPPLGESSWEAILSPGWFFLSTFSLPTAVRIGNGYPTHRYTGKLPGSYRDGYRYVCAFLALFNYSIIP